MSRSLLVSVCFLALLAVAFGVAIDAGDHTVAFNKKVKNVAVSRTIDISSQNEKVKIEVTVANTHKKEEARFYLVTVPAEKVQALSYIRVRQGGDDVPITPVLVSGVEAPEGTVFFKATLKTPIPSEGETKLRINFSFVHTLIPLPARVPQNAKQLLDFHDSLYFFSPYKTTEQSTDVVLSTSRIETYTDDRKTNLKGSTISYGPYKKQKGFASSPLRVHHENNTPQITFKTAVREIEVSHWGNVAVEEHYLVQNTGPELKGAYSRLDYDMGKRKGSFRALSAPLPRLAKDAYYRDRIGNISTSHFRSGSPKSHISLDTRFPIFGGWKTDFYIGYSVPSETVLFVDVEDHTTFVLEVPFSTSFRDTTTDSITVKVILPEGAENIEYEAGFPVESSKIERHFTYLDTYGRPMLVLQHSNLVLYHNKKLRVKYTFSTATMLREPLMLAGMVMFIFVLSMVVVRINLTLHKEKKPKSD